jgi:hypothetical protein
VGSVTGPRLPPCLPAFDHRGIHLPAQDVRREKCRSSWGKVSFRTHAILRYRSTRSIELPVMAARSA